MHFQSQLGQTKVHFSNQGKNASLCIAFWWGIFLFKNRNAWVKKLRQYLPITRWTWILTFTWIDLKNWSLWKLWQRRFIICFFEVRFLAALASWLCRLHRFGLFLADHLGKKFGHQFFFSGPRYVVNPYCLLSDELKTNIRYVRLGCNVDDVITFEISIFDTNLACKTQIKAYKNMSRG